MSSRDVDNRRQRVKTQANESLDTHLQRIERKSIRLVGGSSVKIRCSISDTVTLCASRRVPLHRGRDKSASPATLPPFTSRGARVRGVLTPPDCPQGKVAPPSEQQRARSGVGANFDRSVNGGHRWIISACRGKPVLQKYTYRDSCRACRTRTWSMTPGKRSSIFGHCRRLSQNFQRGLKGTAMSVSVIDTAIEKRNGVRTAIGYRGSDLYRFLTCYFLVLRFQRFLRVFIKSSGVYR